MKTNTTGTIKYATTLLYKIVIGIGVLLVVGGISLYAGVYISYSSYTQTSIKVKNNTLKAYIANNQYTRMLGLSGKIALPKNSAMLFVFDKPDTYGIWMKGMNFSLDIVWLDAQKNIVYSLSRVDPSTYPHVFYPPTEALYVVEFPSGYLESANLKKGDTVFFKL